MKCKQQTRDEVIAHIRENGEWKGRQAFEEHEKWLLGDNYLNVTFDEQDLAEIDGKTILDMKTNMAKKYLYSRAPFSDPGAPVLFFGAVDDD